MEKINLSSDALRQHIFSCLATELRKEYIPSDDEPYMNEQQLSYFKEKLFRWRDQLFNESRSALILLKDDHGREADFLEQGALETNISIKLRTCDRYYRLIQKINGALEQIEVGEYGYCEETGDAIGLKRLEAQEWHEQKERRGRMRW